MSAAVEVPFVRRRRGEADVFVAPPSSEPKRPASRVAKMLALAHTMNALLCDGTVGDQRELAAIMGVTRGRVTQLLDLTLLAPDIQEQLLDGVSRQPITEDALRRVVRARHWEEQRRVWASLARTQAEPETSSPHARLARAAYTEGMSGPSAKPKHRSSEGRTFLPHPDDDADVRAGLEEAERGELLSEAESAACLRALLGDEPARK